MSRNLTWIGLFCAALCAFGCAAENEEPSVTNDAVTAQLPPCDLLNHRAALLPAVKQKIADDLAHFQEGITLRSIAYQTLDYAISEDSGSPYLTVNATASLSNETKLRLHGDIPFYGRTSADRVLGDGTLVNAQCSTRTGFAGASSSIVVFDSQVEVVNASTGVTVREIALDHLVVYAL